MAIYVGDRVEAGIVRYRPLMSDAGDAELHAFAASIRVSPDRHRGPHAKPRGRRAQWSHYRLSEALAGAAFRAGARKADRVKLVECACGKRAAERLRKQLGQHSGEGDPSHGV